MIPTFSIFTDGGSRGNPGPAASGVYIVNAKGKEAYSLGKPLGDTTNNVAEYTAVLLACEWLNKQPVKDITSVHFFLDSELACRQLNGIYKVKSEGLKPLYYSIQEYRGKFAFKTVFSHIPREKNKMADALVNMALDKNSRVSYNKS